jgi:putative CRISPR-associated protein (TIGR02619 family)
MSLLFVTVGMSSVRNEKIGAVGDMDNSDLLAEVRRCFPAPGRSPADRAGLRDRLVEAHKRYWDMPREYITNPDNYRQTSAELISTYQMFTLLAERYPGRTIDRIVLLASATSDGRFAADVVLGVMQSEKYSIPVAKDRIGVYVIPGLDKEFVDLSEAIPAMVREHRPDPAKDLVHFNVTGGFKGTGVVIGMLAADYGFALFYQHESLHIPIFINPKGRMSRRPE